MGSINYHFINHALTFVCGLIIFPIYHETHSVLAVLLNICLTFETKCWKLGSFLLHLYGFLLYLHKKC